MLHNDPSYHNSLMLNKIFRILKRCGKCHTNDTNTELSIIVVSTVCLMSRACGCECFFFVSVGKFGYISMWVTFVRSSENVWWRVWVHHCCCVECDGGASIRRSDLAVCTLVSVFWWVLAENVNGSMSPKVRTHIHGSTHVWLLAIARRHVTKIELHRINTTNAKDGTSSRNRTGPVGHSFSVRAIEPSLQTLVLRSG